MLRSRVYWTGFVWSSWSGARPNFTQGIMCSGLASCSAALRLSMHLDVCGHGGWVVLRCGQDIYRPIESWQRMRMRDRTDYIMTAG